MNRPTDDHADNSGRRDATRDEMNRADHAASDASLKHALRSLPPCVDTARLDALQLRVLAQWQGANPRAAVAQPNGGHPGRSLLLAGGASRRSWALASALLLCVSLAAGFWLQRPDPALDELLQPDVLSQMAIGEM